MKTRKPVPICTDVCRDCPMHRTACFPTLADAIGKVGSEDRLPIPQHIDTARCKKCGFQYMTEQMISGDKSGEYICIPCFEKEHKK